MGKEYNIGEVILHVHSGKPYKIVSYDNKNQKYGLKEYAKSDGELMHVTASFLSAYFDKINGELFDKMEQFNLKKHSVKKFSKGGRFFKEGELNVYAKTVFENEKLDIVAMISWGESNEISLFVNTKKTKKVELLVFDDLKEVKKVIIPQIYNEVVKATEEAAQHGYQGSTVEMVKERIRRDPEYMNTTVLLQAMRMFSEKTKTDEQLFEIFKRTVSGDPTNVEKMKAMASEYRNFLIETKLYDDYLDFVSDNFPKDLGIPLFAKGGEVDYYDFDRKMALIYLDEINEYALKLDKLVTEQTDLEDWVKMKITRVEQSVADVKRSLKGWQKYGSYGQGGVIVKSQLKHIADYSKELLEMVKSGAKLMSWQEAKIAIAGDTLDSIYHRLDYSLGSKKFAKGGKTSSSLKKGDRVEGYFHYDHSYGQYNIIPYNAYADNSEGVVIDVIAGGSGQRYKIQFENGETLTLPEWMLGEYYDKLKFADGGVIRRFDRHAEMSAETRHEILDLIKLPYEEKIYNKLKAQGLSFMEYENYLYGLYDGYDYSQTKRFKDTFAKVKKASLPLYKRIMKVYEIVGKYKFTEAE
jgi:hypothetical protein